MDNHTKLAIVKSLHTLIWVFFNVVLIYMYYAVITDKINVLFWIGLSSIAVECAVLLLNNWTCPLSPLARRYTESARDNFDIYIPNWLAKHNIMIYSIIAAGLAILSVFKYLIVSN